MFEYVRMPNQTIVVRLVRLAIIVAIELKTTVSSFLMKRKFSAWSLPFDTKSLY